MASDPTEVFAMAKGIRKVPASRPQASVERLVEIPEPVVNLTVAERTDQGRAARKRLPRARLSEFEVTDADRDPIALLESQAATRIPQLVPIRYGRMLVSPGTFYRGAALIMAYDLAGSPVSKLKVQACGDAHLSNFGVYASPERHLVLDVNDFDETAPGPWEWDIKRLIVSLEIAARDNGYAVAERDRIVRAAARQYQDGMASFARRGNLDVWYAKYDVESNLPLVQRELDPDRRKEYEKDYAKVRSRDNLQAYKQLVSHDRRHPQFDYDPPLLEPLRQLVTPAEYPVIYQQLSEAVRKYRLTLPSDRKHLLERYKVVDFASKVVGVGSVGIRAWICLLIGRDLEDPLVLQFKEAQESVLERFVGKSGFRSHGQRVVAGQRLMQATSDIFLGWTRPIGFDGVEGDGYVRQLRDWKWSAPVDEMTPRSMAVWGRLCAWTLARAHARSGDGIAIAAYLGRNGAFAKAMLGFARAYADQNERDYMVLKEAVADGRVVAKTGV
jgi:uncharacterized protein (DUF2252 family)